MEKFLNKLAEDEKLRSEFLKQTTSEGAYKVAKPYIGSMSMEEFAAQMVGLAKLLTKAESGELSEGDLDTVAGGFSLGNLFKTITAAGNELKQDVQAIAGAAGQVQGAVDQIKDAADQAAPTLQTVQDSVRNLFGGSNG